MVKVSDMIEGVKISFRTEIHQNQIHKIRRDNQEYTSPSFEFDHRYRQYS